MSDGMLFVDERFERKRVREHTVEELRVLYRDVRDFKRLVKEVKRMDKRSADRTYTQFAHTRFQELRRTFHPINERLKLVDNEEMRRARNWILENFSNAVTVQRKSSLSAKMASVVSSLNAILKQIQDVGVEMQIKEI